MLRNPANKAATTDEIVESEYEKLRFAWEQQLNDTKNQKHDANQENVKFTLMHLFHGYLNQIWNDSENMLQCAQSWNNDDSQKDAAFTMNILGLHLMKQSLRTRQELFHIIDDTPNTFDYFSMPPTITERAKSSYPSYAGSSSSSSACSIASNQRHIKLSSSPSTPTINNTFSNDWQESSTQACKHAFTPGSNYSLYFPTVANEKTQNLSCHFCHEKLGLKKSFSADNFCTLASQISSTCTSSSIETEEHDTTFMNHYCETSNNNSAFDIDSLEEDMLASKKLLMHDQDDLDDGTCHYQEKLLKYQLINELHESSKLQVDDDNVSISSSGTSIEELKMKRSTINNNLLHERLESSSTYLPESIYSSDNCNCDHTTSMPRKKRNLSMFFNMNKTSNARKTSFKDKFKQYRKQSVDKNTMPRSLSNTISQLFSSPSKNGKRQQAQI